MESLLSQTDSFTLILQPEEEDDSSGQLLCSVLFQLASEVIKRNSFVTFLRKEPMVRMPLLLAGENPHVRHLRKLEFVYLSNRHMLVTFFSNFYRWGTAPPCIIIDHLQQYLNEGDPMELCSTLAMLEDARQWIHEKKPQNISLTFMAVAMRVPQAIMENVAAVALLYTDQIWLLKKSAETRQFLLCHTGSNEENSRIVLDEDGRSFTVGSN